MKPVIIIGANGLTDAVNAEINNALEFHELIKIKINGADRGDRDAMIRSLCQENSAELVQRIGNVAIVFRRNTKKPKVHI